MSDLAPYASVDGLAVVLDGAILRLTLARPDKRNAIDDTMMEGLIAAFDRAGRDDGVRAVVLTGEGAHFCAGADIVARNSNSGERPRVGSIQRRVPSLAHRLIPLIATVQLPVVCAVQGWAAGIGFQFALAADFTIAADDARFWEPFVERGFTPDSGATWMLPRVVGLARARELLLLGRQLSGVEAEQWGCVHRAVASADVAAEADALAATLASGASVAIGLTKWLLHSSSDAPLDRHLRDEAFALELSSRSEDFREGLGAFREKRPPDFTGR